MNSWIIILLLLGRGGNCGCRTCSTNCCANKDCVQRDRSCVGGRREEVRRECDCMREREDSRECSSFRSEMTTPPGWSDYSPDRANCDCK